MNCVAEQLQQDPADFTLGRVDVAKRSVAELAASHGESLEMHMLRRRCSLAVRSTPFRAAARLGMALLPAAVFLAADCRNPNAAPAIPSPEVEVARTRDRVLS
jgi:hypothetical protein